VASFWKEYKQIMDFESYDEGYRKNLDTLYGMLGFCNIVLFDSVAKFIPQSLGLIEPPDSQEHQRNCHSYTFGKNTWFEVKNVHDAIKTGKLIETESPEKENVILYYKRASANPIIKHSGIYLGKGKVRSKWANGPVFIHDVFNVPYSYGNIVIFFVRTGEEI